MFPDAPDTTSYLVEMPTDDWVAWKDTVPRSVPLYKRLHHLIRADATPSGEMDESDLSLVMLKFERVAQRVENAEVALDDGDGDRARRELENIREIADGYVE